jgi:hypothetical protein
MLGLRRRRHEGTRDPDAVREGEAVREERRERRGYGRNTVRGVFTLVGVIAAGFLLWLASYLDLGSTGEFWAAMGLVAGAGLALVLSQLLGGWTKWGLPKISLAVLLLGWVPAAVATGWILLTVQPENGWQQARLENWSDSLGILDLVQDIGIFQAAVALGFGAVTGFVFDTTGPRVRKYERDAVVPDEDVHDYDGRDVAQTPTTTPAGDRTVVRDETALPAGTTSREGRVVRERDES